MNHYKVSSQKWTESCRELDVSPLLVATLAHVPRGIVENDYPDRERSEIYERIITVLEFLERLDIEESEEHKMRKKVDAEFQARYAKPADPMNEHLKPTQTTEEFQKSCDKLLSNPPIIEIPKKGN